VWCPDVNRELDKLVNVRSHGCTVLRKIPIASLLNGRCDTAVNDPSNLVDLVQCFCTQRWIEARYILMQRLSEGDPSAVGGAVLDDASKGNA
jgi:hypothetical protein